MTAAAPTNDFRNQLIDKLLMGAVVGTMALACTHLKDISHDVAALKQSAELGRRDISLLEKAVAGAVEQLRDHDRRITVIEARPRTAK